MNLYLISQTETNNYDTYDAAVVAAETEEAARLTHPSGVGCDWNEEWPTWVTDPELVDVTLIGKAIDGTGAGVVLSSFNAS